MMKIFGFSFSEKLLIESLVVVFQRERLQENFYSFPVNCKLLSSMSLNEIKRVKISKYYIYQQWEGLCMT